MIVTSIASRRLIEAVRRAARPDEDVVADSRAGEALRRGFPRAVVVAASRGRSASGAAEASGVPTLSLDGTLLDRWERERRAGAQIVPPERTGYIAFRVGAWLKRKTGRPSWVELVLKDLGRVAGHPLPSPLRGMARRVLEFPSGYTRLRALGAIGGLSAGALKARFRRRGLPSPYTYLRWFRCLAVAHVLSDPSTTTLVAADRVGISSSGNLSRTVQDTTGLTPTRLRTEAGRTMLVTGMAEELMDPAALTAWQDLAPVFLREA